MPILFKTEIKKSSFEGLGLFALEDIPKGSVWWTGDPTVQSKEVVNHKVEPNIPLAENQVEEFVKTNPFDFVKFSVHRAMPYKDGNMLLILRDGTGVTNHSDKPNSQIVFNKQNDYRKLYSVALRDIKAGEEIMESYANYPKRTNDWAEKLIAQYDQECLKFEAEHNIEPKKVQ